MHPNLTHDIQYCVEDIPVLTLARSVNTGLNTVSDLQHRVAGTSDVQKWQERKSTRHYQAR